VLNPQLVKESFAVVEPVADKVASYFYGRLFVENPELRDMFPPFMDIQRDRLFGALVRIVHGVDRPEFLAGFLEQLGRDHRKFGARPAHYEALGRSLIAAIQRYAGEAWTPQVEAAWVAAYSVVARTMIDAARRAALETPDWWLAEIVAHETRSRDDVAVLWLAPDHPFPYEAGQYMSLETPWWPRVWRTYSMANAPRQDNLVELHVRKVDAGWVSSALVNRARPGDKLRLGHPTGLMVSDRTSTRDLVCIAGGTGFAPMKAVIEDMSRWNWYRRVHLFLGGRREDDLYDLPAAQALSRKHSWLTVVPAVSEDDRYRGEQGLVVDVALRYGGWTDEDIYVAGSPEMVRGTVNRLLGSGVSLSRIKFDAFGDPVAARAIERRQARFGSA
jgi:NAD(P)H-flavin reductase/hemoglobin-like flavoprotein